MSSSAQLAKIEMLGGVIGAEVFGINLGAVPDAGVIEQLEDALERYGVLVFRGQRITPAEQVRFTTALGPLEMTRRVSARHAEHPEIFVVGNAGEQVVTFSPNDPSGELEWHTDHIHLDVPARVSLLYACEVPSSGGDTLFACLYSGYDALSEAERARCDALTGIHSIHGLQRYLAAEHHGRADGRYDPVANEVRWPLVRKHPRSGRKGLYFGAKVTVGFDDLDASQSQALVERLVAVTTQAGFRYRHRWQVGDAVLWDNRRVVHAGTYYDYDGPTRLMHRTTLRETEPVQV